MSPKAAKISQLLEVKELRRRLAQLEAAKARRMVDAAKLAVEEAKSYEAHVRETADQRRNDRLKTLLESSGNKTVQNVLAVNTHLMTAEEIALSEDATKICTTAMHEAENRANLEQSKLAQSLRVEERTKKLCERLAKMKQAELLRSE